jgi:MFS family permease
VLLNIMGVIIFPVSTKMIERFNPGMVLALGAALIGVGDLWLAAVPATNLSLWAIAVPLLICGAGFKTAVTAITVVAVNSVPTSKAGMASGTTSMLRDFGLTLGPAIVGAIALTRAGNAIVEKTTPAMEAGIHKLPADLQHAVSSPLGANAVPNPPNPLKEIAFHALSDAYQIGFLVCGVSALVAAVIAALLLRNQAHRDVFTEEEATAEAG